MKKLCAAILLLSVLILNTGCATEAKGVSVSYGDGLITVELEDFVGEYVFRLENENTGDGTLFYVTELTAGKIEAGCQEGWIFPELSFFSASAEDGTSCGGNYVDSSTTTVKVTFAATEKTSGKILLTFSRDTYKSIGGK